MFNIPFLFKTPFDKQTIQDAILGIVDPEDEFSSSDDQEDDMSSSGSSHSSSEETDSRFMDEKGTSFIALHPHQRVSVVNPSFLPKHILDQGNNDDISQISLDFGDVSSIESSVRLNPYGASSEQMEIAMRWRKSIAAAQQNDLESCNAYNEVPKKPKMQKEVSASQGNTRILVTNPCDRDTYRLDDPLNKDDIHLRQLKDANDLPPPPPPPRLHKKKFSESQFQISPPPMRSKSLHNSNKRLRRPTSKTSTTDEFDKTNFIVPNLPRNASCIQPNSKTNRITEVQKELSHPVIEKQKKDVDTTLPISDSDDDSLDHLFRVDNAMEKSDIFKSSLFEPFEDNVSIEDFSLTYSESAQTMGKKDTCVVKCDNDFQTMEHASVIIQSLYRGWLCRYRILSELGIAKRRHWQKREKSQSLTKIHSSIRRDARKLLRMHCLNSMVVAVRIVCAKKIQRCWRNALVELKNRRETGFDISNLPKDWYENMQLVDTGIPFFKDDFEALIGIGVSKCKRTQSSQPLQGPSNDIEFDTEYYQQANQSIYEDEVADEELEVHENSQFLASISLLPKIFNGVIGRFVKIFRKNKDQQSHEGKKVRMKDKKVLKFFKRNKRKLKRNQMRDDLIFETSIPDPLTLYESLEDDTPDVAMTASFESVPFDEI